MDVVVVNKDDMIEVLEHKKVLEYVNSYFKRLTRYGYVKNSSRRSLLRYMSLMDFVNYLYPFMTDNDYSNLDAVLFKMFSKGDCILPYPFICNRKLSVGSPLGYSQIRVSNNNRTVRITEDTNIRVV